MSSHKRFHAATIFGLTNLFAANAAGDELLANWDLCLSALQEDAATSASRIKMPGPEEGSVEGPVDLEKALALRCLQLSVRNSPSSFNNYQ